MIKKLRNLKNIFRPRYKRLVRGALPRNSCDGLNPVPMEKLYYYSLLYPEKLEQVGDYLYIRASKLLRRGRVGHVALTMDALAQLLRTAPPVHREALVDPFLRTAMLCLQSRFPRLQVTATYAFIHFVILKDETLYHHNYEQLLREFAEMCHDKHENLAVQEEVRHAGIQGLEALLMWCDELLDDIYSPATMSIILPCLLFNFNDADYLSGSYAERQRHSMTPPGIAESCLREYVARTSPSRVHFVLTPMLRYLDNHGLWEDEQLPFELFKVVMLSVEAPYAFYLIERLVEHASPLVTQDARTSARVLEVVIVITEAATDEAVGPAAFYCVGRLLQDLVVAVQHFHGVHENAASDVEQYYQDTLVRALEAIAMTLPDYYKLEMLVLVMQHVPIPVRDMRDVWLRYLLLDIVDEVSQQYCSLYLTTALPAQLLRPLLQLSLSPNPRVRLSVHATLQNLVDRKNNATVLREPWKAVMAQNVQQGPTSPLDAAFIRRFGLEIFHALHEGFAVFNNSRRNLRAVFTTAALVIVESISEPTMIEALRFIINIQELVEQGTNQNARWRGELHACALALSRLLVLVAPCAQTPLTALDVRVPTMTPKLLPRSCCSANASASVCGVSAPQDKSTRLAAIHTLLGMSWTPAVRALLIRKRVMDALRNDGWQGVTQHHLAPYSVEVTRPVVTPTGKEHSLANYPIAPLTPMTVPVTYSTDAAETELSTQGCEHITKERKARPQPPVWGTIGGPVQWERANVTTVMLVTTTNNLSSDPPISAKHATRSVEANGSTTMTTPSVSVGSARASSGNAMMLRTYSTRSPQSGMLTLRESIHIPLTPPRAPRTLESEERWDFLKEILMMGDAAVLPPEAASRSFMNVLTEGTGGGSQHSLTSSSSSSTSSLTESPAASRPASATQRKATGFPRGRIPLARSLRRRKTKETKDEEEEVKSEDEESSRGSSRSLPEHSSSELSEEANGQTEDGETEDEEEEISPHGGDSPHRRISFTWPLAGRSSDGGRLGARCTRISIGSAGGGGHSGSRLSGLRSTRSSGDGPRTSHSNLLEDLRRAREGRQGTTDREQSTSIPQTESPVASRPSVGGLDGEHIASDRQSSIEHREITHHNENAVMTPSISFLGEGGAWKRSWAEAVRHYRSRPPSTSATPAAAGAGAGVGAASVEGGAEVSGGAGDRRSTAATQQSLQTGPTETAPHAHRHFSASSGYSSWGMSMSRNRTSLLDTITMRMRTEAAVASTEARFQFTEEQERLRLRFAERPFQELQAPQSPLGRQNGALSDVLTRVLSPVAPPTTPPELFHPIVLPKSLRHFVYEGFQSMVEDEEEGRSEIREESPTDSIHSPPYKTTVSDPYAVPHAVLDMTPNTSATLSDVSDEVKVIPHQEKAVRDKRRCGSVCKKKVRETTFSGKEEVATIPNGSSVSPSPSVTSLSSGAEGYPHIRSPSIQTYEYSTEDTIPPVTSEDTQNVEVVSPTETVNPCQKDSALVPKLEIKCNCLIPNKDLRFQRCNEILNSGANTTIIGSPPHNDYTNTSKLPMNSLLKSPVNGNESVPIVQVNETKYYSKEIKSFEGNFEDDRILRPCEIRVFGKINSVRNIDVPCINKENSMSEHPSTSFMGKKKPDDCSEDQRKIDGYEIKSFKKQMSDSSVSSIPSTRNRFSGSNISCEGVNRSCDDLSRKSKLTNYSATE